MRGLDTNVLLRFLTADDAAQTRRVAALFAAAEREGERFFVSTIALCEAAWTLRGAPYHLDRRQLAAVLGQIVDVDLFEIQERVLVRRAIAQFASGRADFADCLLGQASRAAGCTDTLTFDGKLGGTTPGFSLLE